MQGDALRTDPGQLRAHLVRTEDLKAASPAGELLSEHIRVRGAHLDHCPAVCPLLHDTEGALELTATHRNGSRSRLLSTKTGEGARPSFRSG